MDKHKRMTGRVAAIFAVALVVCLCFTGCGKGEKEEAPEVSVQAVPAATADISRVVNTDAIIFPIAQSAITPKINAPVKKFYVVRGQKVRQGQLLATLENRDLSAAALDNKGAYEQAEAAYSTSIGATLPEENAKAELDLQTTQQELDARKALLTKIFKGGALPRKSWTPPLLCWRRPGVQTNRPQPSGRIKFRGQAGRAEIGQRTAHVGKREAAELGGTAQLF
jgi:multidrug efflux pump subunit AcrA (membrane-fusion protein)